jgi:Tfp pilus assembly pilus retraction ATPase PilT
VRDWVRQGGRPDALAALMGREAAAGTQTFAAHVAQLVAAGVVAAEGPDAAAPARPERGGAARGRR